GAARSPMGSAGAAPGGAASLAFGEALAALDDLGDFGEHVTGDASRPSPEEMAADAEQLPAAAVDIDAIDTTAVAVVVDAFPGIWLTPDAPSPAAAEPVASGGDPPSAGAGTSDGAAITATGAAPAAD